MSAAKRPCRSCERSPCACVTAHMAVKAALKLLPRGRARSDLKILEWMLNRRNRTSCADTGALVLRIPSLKGTSAFRGVREVSKTGGPHVAAGKKE